MLERSAVRRASLRLVWLLILLYLLNNIDRTNIGFAALTINRDLGLTAQSFGVAVGMFYVGYLLCEIPSNIILARTGARRSLARMAIGSGLVTVLTSFAQGPLTFYAARFFLGIAEAGYLVGIVLYLSYWFPAAYRARLNALFMLSLPLAFTLSSAIAGTILNLEWHARVERMAVAVPSRRRARDLRWNIFAVLSQRLSTRRKMAQRRRKRLS